MRITRTTTKSNTPAITPLQVVPPDHYDDVHKTFDLRYAMVDPLTIINMCSPEYNYNPIDWTDNERAMRIVIGQKYIAQMNRHIEFYSKLEESIVAHGVCNPVLLTTGTPKFRSMTEIPPELRSDEMLICEILGGSRILIAAKHKLPIPAIINDYTGMFKSSLKLVTNDDINKCFADAPDALLMTNRGLRISPPTHIHLPIGNQESHNVMAARRKVMGTLR